MTPHTNIAPAATLVAQPNDKYNPNPNLIPLLLQQAMQNERKQQQLFQQQQKSYVSALVGKQSL